MRPSVLAVLLPLFAIACSSDPIDCDELCADASCQGAEADDCSEYCGKVNALASDAGCEDEASGFGDCLGAGDQVCSDENAERCEDKATAVGVCAAAYCQDHAEQCRELTD